MKICELKIQKKFYDMIVSGDKEIEIRKMNKDYITANDIIKFIDLDTKVELGLCEIVYKVRIKPSEMKYLRLDEETKKFIKENYANEENLIAFNVMPLEVVK